MTSYHVASTLIRRHCMSCAPWDAILYGRSKKHILAHHSIIFQGKTGPKGNSFTDASVNKVFTFGYMSTCNTISYLYKHIECSADCFGLIDGLNRSQTNVFGRRDFNMTPMTYVFRQIQKHFLCNATDTCTRPEH